MPNLNNKNQEKTHELSMSFVMSLCGFRMRRAMNFFSSDYMRALRSTNMRPVLLTILCVIDENPGVRQGEIGGALGIARANMVPLISELEEANLVSRVVDPADRRAFIIELTKTGRAQLSKCKTLVRRHDDRVLSNLSASERDQFMTLLEKIVD